jgi:hypothetical protein
VPSTIAEAKSAERERCRFMHFRANVEPDGGPISLELTGPRGLRN